MEGSYTHPLFSCCHRTHMPTLHIFFLSGVSRGLQLICVIAPPPPIHTHTYSSQHHVPLHPALSTSLEFDTEVIVVKLEQLYFMSLTGVPICNRNAQLNTKTQFDNQCVLTLSDVFWKGYTRKSNGKRTGFSYKEGRWGLRINNHFISFQQDNSDSCAVVCITVQIICQTKSWRSWYFVVSLLYKDSWSMMLNPHRELIGKGIKAHWKYWTHI